MGTRPGLCQELLCCLGNFGLSPNNLVLHEVETQVALTFRFKFGSVLVATQLARRVLDTVQRENFADLVEPRAAARACQHIAMT